eukprot:2956029-Heterocapsa_arctica.AAC.1
MYTAAPLPTIIISFPDSPPITVISSHLPHSKYSADDLMTSANLMFPSSARGRTIIGTDANVELGGLPVSELIGPR